MTKELEKTKRKTPLEMFKVIKDLEVADSPLMTVEDCLPFMCEKVEQALLELKAIREAKPSEAMDKLEGLGFGLWNEDKSIVSINGHYFKDAYDTIKQALLKAEKLEKVWEVVKEKSVNVSDLKCCDSVEAYNIFIGTIEYQLTQQEFELIKEMLENE